LLGAGQREFSFLPLGRRDRADPREQDRLGIQGRPDTEVHAANRCPRAASWWSSAGPSRLIEVDRAGHIAKEIKLTPPPATVSRHDQFRGVRKTKDGRYLVCRKGEHEIEELDANGRVLREIPCPATCMKLCRCRTATCLLPAVTATR